MPEDSCGRSETAGILGSLEGALMLRPSSWLVARLLDVPGSLVSLEVMGLVENGVGLGPTVIGIAVGVAVVEGVDTMVVGTKLWLVDVVVIVVNVLGSEDELLVLAGAAGELLSSSLSDSSSSLR